MTPISYQLWSIYWTRWAYFPISQVSWYTKENMSSHGFRTLSFNEFTASRISALVPVWATLFKILALSFTQLTICSGKWCTSTSSFVFSEIKQNHLLSTGPRPRAERMRSLISTSRTRRWCISRIGVANNRCSSSHLRRRFPFTTFCSCWIVCFLVV